jgi:hypothetical protein
MTNLMADVEKKLNTANLVDEIEAASRKRGWQFWLLVPLAVATIAGCAFLVVRRIRHR